MPREHGRAERVADFIQRELAVVLQTEMKDPRVGMVSVQDVRVSSDLGYADIYVSSFAIDSPEEQEALVGVLSGAAGWVRGLLAKRSQMRSTPRLRFPWDALGERSRAMDALIDRARASDGDAPEHKNENEDR